MEEEEFNNKNSKYLEEQDLACAATIFAPRLSLARTPPGSFSTPYSTPPQQTGKRLLSSPEDVQEHARRKVAPRKQVPALPSQPAATSSPILASTSTLAPSTGSTIAELVELSTTSTTGIMEAVKSKTSKLNKDEIAAIGLCVSTVGSVVTHLIARLAQAEQRAAVAEQQIKQCRSAPTLAGPAIAQPAARSYTDAVKVGKDAVPVPIPRRLGPAVAVFPAEDQKDKLKTSEETKKVLQTAVNPVGLGIRVHGLRKTGGAGLMIETASEKDAQAFRAAVPSTLRVAEPRERRPLVALVGIDAEVKPTEIVARLHEQNLRDSEWTLEETEKSIRPLFNRTRRHGRKMWVCDCAPKLRKTLIERGKIYIGWDVVEVNDYIDVTCCRRCHMYGHPEKYCRAKTMTCGKCGEDGHKSSECQATTSTCATCKKLGRKGGPHHTTNQRECPARRHAEERSLATTNYDG